MKRPNEAVIDDVRIQPSKIQPIIVNFQNGELKDAEAKKMECDIFYDESQKNRMLALSNGRIVYSGYRPDLNKEPMYTMLAIHNKRTGKVRLIQAERWQVSPILDSKNNTEDISRGDEVALLNKQFGSKRMKRRTEQYERMKVNVESVKEQLEKTVSNVEIDKADLTLPSVNDESIGNTNVPTCNRNASTESEIYNPYEIVPESKLETLYEAATDVLESNVKGRSKFFTETLNYLKKQSESIVKVAFLLYIDCVATWLNMPIKDAKKRGVEICPYSRLINDHIIESYSMSSAHGRQRPTSMRDKAILHCMVLGLSILNFSLNIEVFSSIVNIRISSKRLTDLARVLGAVPLKSDKSVVVLKLPLPAKLVTFKKGRKK
ncbi:uncharacterized protein LOC107274802 [Cephus cinctus]|uniref:Uncharacterized protein LOC107274802 n=1 Tax=Cephus cinctus TaxID=211228 RepID=A0AAJ7CFW1_CEPCN|nr:uncharacterized protein LOC107274802 [Cephus cinctus]